PPTMVEVNFKVVRIDSYLYLIGLGENSYCSC
ncbi:unnamed protein product, partial [marine sediment metagenome]